MKWVIPTFTAIAGIVIAVFFMRACNPVPPPLVKTDTVWKRYDTTIYLTGKPVPYEVIRNHEVRGPMELDTMYIPQPYPMALEVDTQSIMADYFQTRIYLSKFKGKFGTITVRDSIAQNKLMATSSEESFNIPEVTKTSTEQKRTGYLGFNAGVGKGIAMGGLDLTYVDRKANMFHIQVDYTTLGSLYLGGGVSTKISLFNKK